MRQRFTKIVALPCDWFYADIVAAMEYSLILGLHSRIVWNNVSQTEVAGLYVESELVGLPLFRFHVQQSIRSFRWTSKAFCFAWSHQTICKQYLLAMEMAIRYVDLSWGSPHKGGGMAPNCTCLERTSDISGEKFRHSASIIHVLKTMEISKALCSPPSRCLGIVLSTRHRILILGLTKCFSVHPYIKKTPWHLRPHPSEASSPSTFSKFCLQLCRTLFIWYIYFPSVSLYTALISDSVYNWEDDHAAPAGMLGWKIFVDANV